MITPKINLKNIVFDVIIFIWIALFFILSFFIVLISWYELTVSNKDNPLGLFDIERNMMILSANNDLTQILYYFILLVILSFLIIIFSIFFKDQVIHENCKKCKFQGKSEEFCLNCFGFSRFEDKTEIEFLCSDCDNIFPNETDWCFSCKKCNICCGHIR